MNLKNKCENLFKENKKYVILFLNDFYQTNTIVDYLTIKWIFKNIPNKVIYFIILGQNNFSKIIKIMCIKYNFKYIYIKNLSLLFYLLKNKYSNFMNYLFVYNNFKNNKQIWWIIENLYDNSKVKIIFFNKLTNIRKINYFINYDAVKLF